MWHHRDIEEEKIIQKILNHEMLEPEEVNYAFGNLNVLMKKKENIIVGIMLLIE